MRLRAPRVVVTGLAAAYPFGGMFWHYAHYLLGFARLGYDVLYLEDTGQWVYDDAKLTFIPDGENNAALLGRRLTQLSPDLADRWSYCDANGRWFGRPWTDVVEFCRTAEFFVHVSACCLDRDEYFTAERTIFIDTDPLCTPGTRPGYFEDPTQSTHLQWLRRHNGGQFTFGACAASPTSWIAKSPITWQPTRQPLVLDAIAAHRRPVAARRQALTTIASWKPKEAGPVIRGIEYGGKSRELRRFDAFARRSPIRPEIALSGPAPIQELVAAGWNIRPASDVSHDPWGYLDYLADSTAEWSVAKETYVAGRTGWFSERTASYLALGVPAIVQNTGFREWLPTGEGLFAFETTEEALAAVDAVRRDPKRHADAALEIAYAHFDARRVLAELLTSSSSAVHETRRIAT